MHNGIDLVATKDGKTGQTDYITAHTGGVVESVGYNSSAGYYVQIRVSASSIMVYYHLKAMATVKKGASVKKGDRLGYMGKTGSATGSHLHWGIKKNGAWIDPTPYLDKDYVDESEKMTVDGLWDEALTRRLQQIFDTPVDGVVSNQYLCYKADNPGLTSGWDWKDKPNGKGSLLIKAMQKWAGMPADKRDGEAGPDTFRYIQKKLGTIVDGHVSCPSVMVKALQKWANSQ